MSTALMVVWIEPPDDLDREFNDWYDTEHLPGKLQIPGFLTGRRFRKDSVPRYGVCYDLASVEVLSSPAFVATTGTNASPWTKRLMRNVSSRERTAYRQLFPGAELIAAAHRWVAFESVAATRPELEEHTRSVRCRSTVRARLFLRHGGPEAGAHLLCYTADDDEALRRAALRDDGLTCARFIEAPPSCAPIEPIKG